MDRALMADRASLGRSSAVNAFTGAYPGQTSPMSGTIAERLQVKVADMSPTTYPGALYLVEGVYVAAADASSGNALNNASYRLVTISGTAFDMTPTASMNISVPAIYAWKFDGLGAGVPDPGVGIVIADVPNEGRFFVGSKATDLGNGNWRYDYAVYNLNSHRSGGSFFVPLPPGATVSGIGFHDVDYHSGEPFANTDWVSTVNANGVTWSSPQTFAQNANTNALRWGTMYNFWFTANLSPGTSDIALGLFRPGSPTAIAASATVPAPCGDQNEDMVVDGDDFGVFLLAYGHCGSGGSFDADADMDGDGCVTLVDYQQWLGCYQTFVGNPDATAPTSGDVGDINGDHLYDARDIEPFLNVLLLPGQATFRELFVSDFNADGTYNEFDINAFVSKLLEP